MVCKYFLPCPGSCSPSMFHFGLIFGEVKKGSKFIFFLLVNIQLSWHHVLENPFFPCKIILALLPKSPAMQVPRERRRSRRRSHKRQALFLLCGPLASLYASRGPDTDRGTVSSAPDVPSPRPLTFLPLQAVQGGGRGITMRPQWLLGFISLQGP